MGQCLGCWQALDGACLPCSLHGQIFNMAGFGMRERGFNSIISGMIVSHYSAVTSSAGMREGCLLRGGMFVAAVVTWITLLIIITHPLLLFLVRKYEKCRLIGAVCCRFNIQIEGLRGKAACVFVPVWCTCMYMRVCMCGVSVPVCWNTNW